MGSYWCRSVLYGNYCKELRLFGSMKGVQGRWRVGVSRGDCHYMGNIEMFKEGWWILRVIIEEDNNYGGIV